MREIPVHGGFKALVDDEDYGYLSLFKWYIGTRGYVIRNSWRNGKSSPIKMHRDVLKLKVGDPQVDHDDRNKLNNQKHNLIPTTNVKNCLNKGMYKNNTSGVKGVRWDPLSQNWHARITINYKLINLGRFATLEEATEVRRRAEKEDKEKRG